jgi:hypothetical protein
MTVECVLTPSAAVNIAVLVVVNAFAMTLVVLEFTFVFAVVEVALGLEFLLKLARTSGDEFVYELFYEFVLLT